MRGRLQWIVVTGLAVLLAGAAIALLIAVSKPLQIGWHRHQMQQAWDEHSSGNAKGYRRYRSHLEALVRLGEVTEHKYTFSHLRAPTKESTQLFDSFQAGACPPLLDFYSAQRTSTPEPIVLTLWYERQFRDEWIEFLDAADDPNYRENSETCD